MSKVEYKFPEGSWLNAYKNRYGLVEVDISDGFKRRKKIWPLV